MTDRADQAVAEFLVRSFGASAKAWCEQPLSELPHTVRSFVGSAALAANPDLAADAVSTTFGWQDLSSWLRHTALPDRLRPRWARLRPANTSDYWTLYVAATDPETGSTWRFRGGTPSFQTFTDTLYEGVLAQFVVQQADTPEPVGLVTLYNPDPWSRTAYFGYYRCAHDLAPGLMTEGLMLLISHALSNFDMRYLYCEVPDSNAHLTAGMEALGVLEQVGYLPGRVFHHGRFEGLSTFQLSPASWSQCFANWVFA